MAVLINFKICDNAKECSGIAVCKTGALSWDEKKNTIKIDNSKCVSCGACEKACMIQAIKVACSDKEYAKLKKEIDNDPRGMADLFVDRYGAQPIPSAFLESDKDFDPENIHSNKKMAVEFFNDDSVMCLLHSIPIKSLIGDLQINYIKLKITKKYLIKKYRISKLPALVFFKGGKIIGKIEGYYGVEKKPELRSKIDKILK